MRWWIDRNFALDYTLKSLEKILDGQPYHVIRDLRRMLKAAAYRARVAYDQPTEHRDLLRREHARWADTSTWQLINAVDSCGT